jgi:drug/metabolite transporter (DMT)-like permease
VVTVFGLTAQNLAMRRLDASQVATFGNAAPVLTVGWGVWLFGEAVTPALALGGVLTLGGLLWAGRPAREREPLALDRLAPAALPRR